MGNKVNKGLVGICIVCVALSTAWAITTFNALEKVEKYQAEALKYAEEAAQLRAVLINLDPASFTKAPAEPQNGKYEFVFVVKSDGDKTLAAKNRNLLNIKQLSNGDKWQGQIGVDKFGHAIFEHEAYSIRAGAMVLKNYQHRHGIDTINKLVRRFAEANHEPYAKHLSKRLGVGVDEKIELIKYLPELLAGMAQFETGMRLEKAHYALIEAAYK